MSQTGQVETHTVDGGGGGHAHTSDSKYVVIALVLGVITAVEVGLYYVDTGAANAPLLLIFAALKFVIVAMYFMHLRFDNKFFTRVFFGGLALALAVYITVLFTFHVFGD